MDPIPTLEYIADSPPQEHGGFHPNTVQCAKDALATIAWLREVNADLLAACKAALADYEMLNLATANLKGFDRIHPFTITPTTLRAAITKAEGTP